VNAERTLVTLVAQTGRVQDTVAAGVESQHFAAADCRALFDFCLEHSQKWGQPASFKVVKASHPAQGFEFEPTHDAFEFVLNRFIGDVKRRHALVALEEIATYLDDPQADMTRVDELMVEAATRTSQLVPGARVGSFKAMKQRIAEYNVSKERGSWKGIQMGIPEFDELTLGIQPHEFVSVAGWQGTGKSTLLSYMTWHAYLQGATPLIFSLEMEAAALMRKYDLLAMNWQRDLHEAVDSISLKGGGMTDKDLARWEAQAKLAEQAVPDIWIVDDIGRPTLERVWSEISRRKPGIVGVDYVSLMEPPGRASESIWQDLTRLTRGLKIMARTLKVPIIGLSQTNIEGAAQGARLENIAYSRSLGQDSDLVLGLHQTEDMRQQKQMELRMLKNRDGRVTNADMLWDPGLARFLPWKDEYKFSKEPVT
jgi:replicative DNA helicase